MSLAEKTIKNLPLEPGVTFKNAKGEVIYVGKSARLRARFYDPNFDYVFWHIEALKAPIRSYFINYKTEVFGLG